MREPEPDRAVIRPQEIFSLEGKQAVSNWKASSAGKPFDTAGTLRNKHILGENEEITHECCVSYNQT